MTKSTELSEIAADVEREGLSIRPDFLTGVEVADLVHEMKQLQFRPAGVGHGATRVNNVRRDEISWFEPANLMPAQSVVWQKIEQLRAILNQELFLGLWETEAHFAIYEPGGFYKKHLDSFDASNKRAVSMVIYLNQEWQVGDGGEFQTASRIIEPRAGTMVCFLSEKIEHEVLIAHKERKSIAAWLRRR